MNSRPSEVLPASLSDATELARIQRWFQGVISNPDGVAAGADSPEAQNEFPSATHPLESILTGSSKLDPADRIAVYANAYFARLVECLGEVFPILKRTLGAEGFDGFAVEYLKGNPSRSYTLHRLGEKFPEYLAASRPPREDANTPDWADFLVDLARFELVLYEVFDGPGIEQGPKLDPARLAELDGPVAETARLLPAPCLRLFRSEFPISDFYTEARQADDGDVDGLEFPEPRESFVAITRCNYVVRRLPLEREEFVLLQELMTGAPLNPSLERAAERDALSESRISHWFARWASEDLFTGWSTP
jgi:hypothetical protein